MASSPPSMDDTLRDLAAFRAHRDRTRCSSGRLLSAFLFTLAAHTVAAEDMSGLPRLLPQALRFVTASSGDEVHLTCVVQNLQQYSVVWSKRGEEHPLTIRNFVYTKDRRLSVENSTSVAEGISVWKLVIRDANQSDSGVYECRVPMRNILLHYDVQLAVTAARVDGSAPPAVTLGEARSRTVDKGAPFSLQCNSTSTEEPRRRPMPPEVEWFKDGIKVDSVALSSVLITNQISGRVRISTLIVERSTMEDAGEYICRTSERTFAEVKVHVLKVDKDNKKREFFPKASDKGAQTSQRASSAASRRRLLAAGASIILPCLLALVSFMNGS